MSFQPVIPLGGLAGWEFLKRTRERQETSFATTSRMDRVARDFPNAFNSLRNVDDLLGNRQVLDVTLGAFGLQADLDNRAFIRKVITDGTTGREAIANRLADKRYLALARELAHLAPSATGSAPQGLAGSLLARYQTLSFEVAVGEADEAMRLAMVLERKLPEIAQSGSSESARWFSILGDPPTRKVLETALGLPKEFAALDIDMQADRLRGAMRKRFGTDTLAALAEPAMVERINQRFLLMDQLQGSQSGMSGAAIALSLLSNV